MVDVGAENVQSPRRSKFRKKMSGVGFSVAYPSSFVIKRLPYLKYQLTITRVKDTGKVIYIATKVKFCKRVVAFVKKENCTALEKFTNLLSGNIQDIIIFYVKMAAWQRFYLISGLCAFLTS